MQTFMFMGLETVDMSVAEMNDEEIHDKIVEEDNLQPIFNKRADELEKGEEIYHPDDEEWYVIEFVDHDGEYISVMFEQAGFLDLFDVDQTIKVRQ